MTNANVYQKVTEIMERLNEEDFTLDEKGLKVHSDGSFVGIKVIKTGVEQGNLASLLINALGFELYFLENLVAAGFEPIEESIIIDGVAYKWFSLKGEDSVQGYLRIDTQFYIKDENDNFVDDMSIYKIGGQYDYRSFQRWGEGCKRYITPERANYALEKLNKLNQIAGMFHTFCIGANPV